MNVCGSMRNLPQCGVQLPFQQHVELLVVVVAFFGG